jgi:hypothetical protein
MVQVDYEKIVDIAPILNKAQKAKQDLTQKVVMLHYYAMDLL